MLFGVTDGVTDEIFARAFAVYAKGHSNHCTRSSFHGVFLFVADGGADEVEVHVENPIQPDCYTHWRLTGCATIPDEFIRK